LLAGLRLKDLGFSRVCKLQASNFHFRPNPKSIQIAEDSTSLTKMGCEEEITKVCMCVVCLTISLWLQNPAADWKNWSLWVKELLLL